MKIDGQFYKIYPYPEQIKAHDDYWLAVNDKEYYENYENYFQLYGDHLPEADVTMSCYSCGSPHLLHDGADVEMSCYIIGVHT